MSKKYVLRTEFDPGKFRVDYSRELNQEQLRVVSEGDGPTLVLAGAGSGKTRTIVYRVAYLLERGIRPDNILLVTFTNKAAKEMLFRVEQLLGSFPHSLWGGTFHHVANRLLRKYARLLGYDSNFTILDEEDSKDLIALAIKSLRIDPKQVRFPSSSVIRGLISFSRNTGEDLESLLTTSKPEFVRVMPQLMEVAGEYEARKRRANAMDFDDLLVQLRKLLQDHAGVRQKLATQFKYVLVDEYQDTNQLQAEIVRLLSSVHKNILVVGDDAQSIYAFRGADIDNILSFPKQFPGAKVFKLETNYRSTQPILNVANEVIKQNREQFQKKLQHVREGTEKPVLVPAASDEQEAEFIAQRILELREDGIPLREMAVLFRAAFHSQAVEFELTRRDIPYEFRGGLKFFDRAHIKDVIAYLKVVNNPRDEMSFLRVLRHQVGIGEQTASRIFEAVQNVMPAEADERAMESVFETLTIDSRGERGWKTFRNIYDALLADRGQGPEILVQLVMESEYRDYLKNQYPDADDRLADLEQLALFAGKYQDLESFLSEVSLQEGFGVAGAGETSSDEERIVLTTVHQAKGLEWRVVFLIHLSDAAFPHPRALSENGGVEEERRLFYVAVTRSQEYLYLTYSLASGYRTMDLHLNAPSPFLKEIPDRLLETYELSESTQASQDAIEDPDQIIDLDGDRKPAGLLDRVLKSQSEKRRRRKPSNQSWTQRR